MHWSPSSKTALAEAELEYPEGHISKSIYVAFNVQEVSEALEDWKEGLRVAIWTTTPWTIPANLAVAVNTELSYSVVDHIKTGRLLVATDLIDTLAVSHNIYHTSLCIPLYYTRVKLQTKLFQFLTLPFPPHRKNSTSPNPKPSKPSPHSPDPPSSAPPTATPSTPAHPPSSPEATTSPPNPEPAWSTPPLATAKKTTPPGSRTTSSCSLPSTTWGSSRSRPGRRLWV